MKLEVVVNEINFNRKPAIIQAVLIVLECLFSAIITLMCFPPYMSFELYSCGVLSLKDWYTVFQNPLINHTQIVRCAQEAVYPL